MTKVIVSPAIWVRFTPYLINWATKEFGTGCTVSGHPVLELRTLEGVRQILREQVVENVDLTSKCDNSLSQLRYDIIAATLDIKSSLQDSSGNITPNILQPFLPVNVPAYLLTENGAMRPFSRLMQLRHRTASIVASKVYHAFWKAVHTFATNSEPFNTDREMLECFCEEHNIGQLYIEDLRNQYQRLMRKNYSVNKS